MTVEQKLERNKELVQRYLAGEPISVLRADYRLTRGRIFQILKQSGVAPTRQPRQSSAVNRDQFLGVNLSESVKDALRAEAERRGISMSALSSEMLKEMLITCGYPLEAEKIA